MRALPLPVALGDCINHAYQSGGDEDTLRDIGDRIRATLPEHDRDAFTDAVEMCGLLLSEPAECEGHPDDGAMNGPAGETFYCDGSCVA